MLAIQLESKEFALAILGEDKDHSVRREPRRRGDALGYFTYPTTQTHADVPKDIFTGSDCLRVCVNIELFNIEQRRFLHNLKWKQPKSPLQIVVLVEGEIEGRVSIASTASEYPLAIFRIFRSLARK